MSTQESKSPNLSDMDPVELDRYCAEKGQSFAKTDKVSTSQLRNVFSKISSIRSYYRNPGRMQRDVLVDRLRRDLVLLKPMLAYAKGRDAKLTHFVSEMRSLVDKAVSSLDSESKQISNEVRFKSLDNFFSIVEGFVAYHKYHGGKD